MPGGGGAREGSSPPHERLQLILNKEKRKNTALIVEQISITVLLLLKEINFMFNCCHV